MKRYRTIVADPPWDHSDGTGVHIDSGAITRPSYDTMSLDKIAALPIGLLAAPESHIYLWTTSRYLFDAKAIAEGWGFEYSATLVWCKAARGFSMGGKYASNVEFVLFCRERHGAVRITSYLADCAQSIGVTVQDVNKAMGTSDMAGWWLSRLPHRARIPTVEQYAQIKVLVGADDRYDEDVCLVNDHRHDDRKCDTRWFTWPRGKHSEKPEAFLDLVEQMSPGPYCELFARRARFGWDYWGHESLGTAEMPETAA